MGTVHTGLLHLTSMGQRRKGLWRSFFNAAVLWTAVLPSAGDARAVPRA